MKLGELRKLLEEYASKHEGADEYEVYIEGCDCLRMPLVVAEYDKNEVLIRTY